MTKDISQTILNLAEALKGEQAKTPRDGQPNTRPEDDRRYNPAAVEEKWSAAWQSDPKLYAADPPTSAKKKYYVLEMLPYPSGALHM